MHLVEISPPKDYSLKFSLVIYSVIHTDKGSTFFARQKVF